MLEAVEIFSGAGGMSCGLRAAGITVRAGFDRNPHCVESFAANFPNAKAEAIDVSDLKASSLLAQVRDRDNLVLAGCPPCQLFSQLHRRTDPVGPEFAHYLRLVWAVRPAYLVFENVPRIRRYQDAWAELLTRLARRGYHTDHRVISAERFGVPQKRRRLVLVASRRPIRLGDPSPLDRARTVRDAIGHLPEADPCIPNHVTMNLSRENKNRMLATGVDGGRSKIPRVPFDDSYGRMRWDLPAPTITTRCVSFSNGRFGHPEHNRAITVREAALLQGFPESYRFVGGIKETARQVGNAVPPPLAEWLGREILRHHAEMLTSSACR